MNTYLLDTASIDRELDESERAIEAHVQNLETLIKNKVSACNYDANATEDSVDTLDNMLMSNHDDKETSITEDS